MSDVADCASSAAINSSTGGSRRAANCLPSIFHRLPECRPRASGVGAFFEPDIIRKMLVNPANFSAAQPSLNWPLDEVDQALESSPVQPHVLIVPLSLQFPNFVTNHKSHVGLFDPATFLVEGTGRASPPLADPNESRNRARLDLHDCTESLTSWSES